MHVGMNPDAGAGYPSRHRVPHARGDEPDVLYTVDRKPEAFPMHVGMNRPQ